MKQIIITILVVVGIVGGAVLLSGGGDVAAGEPSNNFYGAEEGIITVREYGDFECPACAGFFPIVSQIKEQFKDNVRFEYKHFPLVQIHGNAQAELLFRGDRMFDFSEESCNGKRNTRVSGRTLEV